jgi:two-component system cell cycle response regulator
LSNKITVLIVDDQAAGREVLEAVLDGQGYELAFAENGLSALAHAETLLPDLILLDVMMPDLDGYEVCRRLRSNPALAEVPVVMITALDDDAAIVRGLEAGADDYLAKPIRRNELRARVRSIARLNRYRKLENQRRQIDWIVEQAREGFVLLTSEDEVTYANPPAQGWLGLAAAPAGRTDFLELARGQHYRLEPSDNWKSWPADTDQPRYLVGGPGQASAQWLSVELLQLPSPDIAQRLVRLRDVTVEMAAQRDLYSFHSALQHKMRTPLIAIVAGLDLMAHQAGKLSSADMSDLATGALRGAERLQNEIQDILQYLNPHQAGLNGPESKAADVAELAAQIAADLALDPLAITIAPDLPQKSLALSRQAMELILSELLENCKKFHPNHKPAVALTLAAGGPEALAFSLRDDGRHLSAMQLARAWQPYYQGEAVFTGETPGMGLGLPLVARLVWETGGRCRMTNRSDQPGIVVELLLPYGTDESAPIR